MPRKIEYIKDVGSLKEGHVEERSDIDANILVLLGVARNYVVEASAAPESRALVAEDIGIQEVPGYTSRGQRRKVYRSKKPETGGEGKGYRRRDMVAEKRP
jgi:hypothetical protein